MNLNELTPAPWSTGGTFYLRPGPNTKWVWGPKQSQTDQSGICVARDTTADDAEFIALARNAFDGDPEALAWWEANRKKRPSPSQT